ncbi:DUF3572 family protein [Methylobacterium brachythecii]|uniref:DUF3572 family protein n=1 Tax=Methylobacterium brachythecii TaxID=1176177 RepID=A0A7W6F898_9HYPH|nr:DUF3572 family protein [Methylobacterium brachythecii]MBB3904233.1 hypothetical protein [Methylobacterium brachythecii]GLS45105.1 hypothetical protein GCM10007884_30940 [Methylobacterium brachythecii]
MSKAFTDAEVLVAEVLSFLAGDVERLIQFFEATGLSASLIRQAATDPGFNQAILEYAASDELRLLELARHAGRDPAHFASAATAIDTSPESQTTSPRAALNRPTNLARRYEATSPCE